MKMHVSSALLILADCRWGAKDTHLVQEWVPLHAQPGIPLLHLQLGIPPQLARAVLGLGRGSLGHRWKLLLQQRWLMVAGAHPGCLEVPTIQTDNGNRSRVHRPRAHRTQDMFLVSSGQSLQCSAKVQHTCITWLGG